jgi:uncharacterized protein YjbI with pentapeptide repeats
MRSLLQSLLSGRDTDTDESDVSTEEAVEQQEVASLGPEVSRVHITADAPEGLIPASRLPSAADVLADLFRDDASANSAEAFQSYRVPAQLEQQDEADAGSSIPSEPEYAVGSQRPVLCDLPVPDEVAAEPALVAEPEPPAEPEIAAGAEFKPDTPAQPEAQEVSQPAPQPDEKFAADATASVADETPEPELTPEIAMSVDLAEQVLDGHTPGDFPSISAVVSDPSESVPVFARPMIRLATSDWAFEEKLAAHKEWVESRGMAGTKADLAEADLQHSDLINVNLRHADLQGANLKSADLLLADLRDSCLVRTNLEESCLVGANLEGANLEGATLDGAMGVLPRQLAGANLHDASLPDQIARFEARALFGKASQTAMQFFTAMMAISAVSALVIWQTRDLQLLTDSSIFRFLRSRAAAALPTDQVYLIAPVALFIVYLVLQFHLQTLWDAVLQLPAIFPDGAEIGQDSPRIIRALLRAHFRWMNKDAPSTRTIERMLALVLAYWVVPTTLLLFWARYLTLQDLHGTTLHLLLAAVAFGVALYSTTKIGRPEERWAVEATRSWDWPARLRELNPLKAAAGLALILLLLSVGTTKGVPHGRTRAPQFSAFSIRRWAPNVFWFLGYDPYANLTEASMSTAPPNWSGADTQISVVKGARLNDMNFRYAQAYGVFLANARLWHSNFEGAFLSDADLRGSDLGQATLRYAVMDRARLFHTNLDRADLNGANLDRADFRESNLSYCSLVDSVLIDAQFQNATLYGARLTNSAMARVNLEKTDLRSAYLDSVDLEHADMRNSYLWSAKLPGASLVNARLDGSIFINADLQGSDLRGAEVSGTVLSGANLTGSIIEGTDLRGALGLTAAQICSTKSRRGAILTDSLASQVQAECGGPLLVAPAPANPAPADGGQAAAVQHDQNAKMVVATGSKHP